MIIQGKYNKCTVFTDNIDNTTTSQLIELLNQEFVKDSKIAIMPDTHAGAGCVIGTTMTIQDKIVPNLVGVDIGCGMHVISLGNIDIDFKKLDEICHIIPSGMNVWDTDEHNTFDISNIYCYDNLKNIKHLERSLGTLGGGNHFIEIDRDLDNNKYLIIHTGSRNLGKQVAEYYQRLAVRDRNDDHTRDKIDAAIEKLKSEGKEKDIENTIKILKMQHTPIPDDLCYLTGDHFNDYLHDLDICQKFAYQNRVVIAQLICDYMGWYYNTDNIEWAHKHSWHTIHNYIDLDKMILRKGAVSADRGELLLIPLNMRDGSLICVGKGNPDWNYSAPHGSGRVLSRKQAKEQISLDDYEKSMFGIYSTCISENTLDESPMAYKPSKEIIANIQPTVEIASIVVPIYNFKANEESRSYK